MIGRQGATTSILWLAEVARIHAIHRLESAAPLYRETEPGRLAPDESTKENAASDRLDEIATVRIELRDPVP